MSERKQFIEKAKARIDQWNAEIDKMKAKADEAEADAKINYQKQIDGMRVQRDEAEAKLKELREASDDAWHDMVLPRFSSGLFRAMFAMKEIWNGKEVHRRVSP